MAELKELFERRDEIVDRLTRGILVAIPNVIEAAQAFVREQEGTTGTLEWKDVSYFNEDEYILFIGVLEYQIGELVTLPNGMEFEVTEQTIDHFKRVIRLGIPYDLAVRGSVDDIFDFFEASAIEMAENNDPDDLFEPLGQLPVSDVDNTQFDLDDLTEDQREQLKLFSLSMNGDK